MLGHNLIGIFINIEISINKTMWKSETINEHVNKIQTWIIKLTLFFIFDMINYF